MKHLIVNASPLILLGKMGRLDLFDGLADRVSVPNEVFKEMKLEEKGSFLDPSLKRAALSLAHEDS